MAQSWDQVDLSCSFVHPAEGEPAEFIVPPAETRAAVREMLKDHFPEGPATAIESHKAYCEWRQANAGIFFKADKDRPQIAEIGRRWRAFLNAWQNFDAKEQWMAGRVHARPEFGSALKFGRAQAMQKLSWRDRRTNARSSNNNTKERER